MDALFRFCKPKIQYSICFNPGLDCIIIETDCILYNIIEEAFRLCGASLVAQRLKRLPPMREIQVRSLGREDPLEREMVTHSSILAWRIPWTEKPGRLLSTGSRESDTTE